MEFSYNQTTSKFADSNDGSRTHGRPLRCDAQKQRRLHHAARPSGHGHLPPATPSESFDTKYTRRTMTNKNDKNDKIKTRTGAQPAAIHFFEM